ncbi:MAG: hypothetical protein AAGA83_04815, partial [Cyanobacteria bacterium P01_F01_bin.116]
ERWLKYGIGDGICDPLITDPLIIFSNPLFGLLTNHQSVLVQLNRYVFCLLPVFSLGAIQY